MLSHFRSGQIYIKKYLENVIDSSINRSVYYIAILLKLLIYTYGENHSVLYVTESLRIWTYWVAI